MTTVKMKSDKIKLYEMRENNISIPYETITQPIIYTEIKDVNLMENKRKKLDVFPFSIKQRNLESFIFNVLEYSQAEIKITDIETSNDDYNADIMEMVRNNQWNSKIIDEINKDGFEIESISFIYKNIEYYISKNGIFSINYPDDYKFNDLFQFEFIQKIIGLE